MGRRNLSEFLTVQMPTLKCLAMRVKYMAHTCLNQQLLLNIEVIIAWDLVPITAASRRPQRETLGETCHLWSTCHVILMQLGNSCYMYIKLCPSIFNVIGGGGLVHANPCISPWYFFRIITKMWHFVANFSKLKIWTNYPLDFVNIYE